MAAAAPTQTPAAAADAQPSASVDATLSGSRLTSAPATGASRSPASAAASSDAGTAPAAPVAVPPALQPAATAPVSAPAAAQPMPRQVLLPQVTGPVLSIAAAGDGDHSVTLTVTPENLGPVTVRAHIQGAAIHIELHAPSDAGRDALRAILVDLRRDLAAAAPQSSLSVATGDAGAGNPNSAGPGSGGPGSSASGSNGTGSNGTTAHGSGPGPNASDSGRGQPARGPYPTSLGRPVTSAQGGLDILA
jgi:flagellar hook-length control protein FliK